MTLLGPGMVWVCSRSKVLCKLRGLALVLSWTSSTAVLHGHGPWMALWNKFCAVSQPLRVLATSATHRTTRRLSSSRVVVMHRVTTQQPVIVCSVCGLTRIDRSWAGLWGETVPGVLEPWCQEQEVLIDWAAARLVLINAQRPLLWMTNSYAFLQSGKEAQYAGQQL